MNLNTFIEIITNIKNIYEIKNNELTLQVLSIRNFTTRFSFNNI